MTIRRIEVLDPQLANKIAAGEVVERPASVVKELVENSLDACATSVTVEIKEGGAEYIRVTDNGCGIPAEDVKTAFLRHATSKLHSVEGLDEIETLGFRGEALASIASVSHVSVRTRTEAEDAGTAINIDGGVIRDCLPCGCPVGTNFEVRELFYNVPARLKFLKNPRSEAAAVGDYLQRLILGSTNVSFKFISGGKPVYHSAGDGSLSNAIVCVYGPDVSEHLKKVRYDDGYILIDGYCGDEFLSRNNRMQQSIFINGRYIRSQQLSFAAQRAYETRLMVGRFPFFVLNIKISPREVDVNVHPNKLTVRFRDEERVSSAVLFAVRDALNGNNEFPETAEPMIESPKLTAVDVYEALGKKATPQDQSLADSLNEVISEVKETPPVKPAAPAKKPPVYVRDVAASEPAVSTADVNGVVRYSFIERPSFVPEESEAITFGISPYTIIGTVFDTYIIVEQGDSVFYIDQHAAHERINYEKLIKGELKFESQILLTAKVLTLSPTDYACLMDNIERFTELGFDIEEFGALSVSIHAVPNGIKQESVERLVSDMIGIIRKNGGVEELDLVRSSLIQHSCKHAVKAGQTLSLRGIEEILSHYADGSTPLTCPHGRPVMVRVSKRDFEKMFKRIQ